MTLPRLLPLFAVLLALLPIATRADDTPTPPEGFVALFNGKDLSGWKGLGHYNPAKYRKLSAEARRELDKRNAAAFAKHWWVEDGELVNDGAGPYATTPRDYGDFELWVEFKIGKGADSGVYLRGIPQVQIWDTNESGGKWRHGAKKGSGGLWNNKKHERWPLVHADKPLGQWNSLKIKVIGDRVTVHLNDKLVVDNVPLENYWDRKKPAFETGPLQLQTHGAETRWRNIFVREIPRKKPAATERPDAYP